MNWYNPKDVIRMIGAKKYQVSQCKRLSIPRKREELLDKCRSQLSKSLSALYKNKPYNVYTTSNRKEPEFLKRSRSILDKNPGISMK
jgi:hypothetical protein